MPDRPQAWAIALLAVAFLAGVGAGWLIRDWTGDLPEPRYRETDAMVSYLAHALSLSAPQQDSVRAVLRRHRPELEGIRNLVRVRFDSLRATIQNEISAQLTPVQRQRYRDLVARVEHQDDSASKEHK